MKSTILLALVATALPALAGSGKAPAPVAPPAPAPAGLSYDNASLGYDYNFDSEMSGLGLGTQVSLTDNIFAQGGVRFYGDDVFDNFTANANLGVHLPVTSSVDFVATAGALFTEDDTFFRAAAGLRAFLGPVDTFVGARYTDVDNNPWDAVAELWVPVAGAIDVGITGSINLEETDNYSIGGGFRYRFK